MRQFSILLLTINFLCLNPLFGYENDCLRPYMTEAEIYLNNSNPDYASAITTYEEALKSCPLSNNDKESIITKLNLVHATVKANLMAEAAKTQAALAAAQNAQKLEKEQRLIAEKAQALSTQQAFISEAGRLALLADEEQTDLQQKLFLAFEAMKKIDSSKTSQSEILRVFGDAVRENFVFGKPAAAESVNAAVLLNNSLIFTNQNELVFQTKEKVISANKEGAGIINMKSFGEQVVSFDKNNAIKFWDSEGKILKKQQEHQGPINFVTVGEANKLMVSGGRDNQAIIWDNKGEKVAILPHQASVQAGGISSANNLIFTRSADNKVALWSMKGEAIKILEHENYVFDASFLNNQLITAEANGSVSIWDTSGNPVKQIKQENAALKLIVAPNQEYFLTIYGGGTAILRNQAGEELFTSTTLENEEATGNLINELIRVESALFLPQEKKLLIQGGARVQLVDFEGNVLAGFQHAAAINEVKISPDGQFILTTSQDGTAKLWNPKGEILLNLDKFKGQVIDGHFSPNGQSLLAFDKYGEIQICPIPIFKYQEMLTNQPNWMAEKRAKYGLR